MEASHSAELKAIQQRIEAAESSLTLKEAELNRAREKVNIYTPPELVLLDYYSLILCIDSIAVMYVTKDKMLCH